MVDNCASNIINYYQWTVLLNHNVLCLCARYLYNFLNVISVGQNKNDISGHIATEFILRNVQKIIINVYLMIFTLLLISRERENRVFT